MVFCVERVSEIPETLELPEVILEPSETLEPLLETPEVSKMLEPYIPTVISKTLELYIQDMERKESAMSQSHKVVGTMDT